MDKVKVESFLSSTILFLVNIAAIAIVEITGQLFFRLGIIHIIAILFIALSIIIIFVRYYSYDPILEKFFLSSLAALLVLALSHIVEYFSMSMGNFVDYSDSVLVNTTNFYLISLMLVIIGAESFLRIRDSRSAKQIRALIGLIAALIILIFVLTTKKDLISLEPDNPMPYAYLAMVMFFGMLALKKVGRIGKHVGISAAFVKFLSGSIILLVLSTVPYILYDLLEHKFGFPVYQIMYLSHFLFYASLSLFFLAFGKVKITSGVYKAVKKITPSVPTV